jgi:hypothetical protein
MKKYIHGYIVNGQTLIKDLASWSTDTLNGNKPMIISFNEIESGYENISSIELWDSYGEQFEKCKQIKYIFDETNWESLSIEEKKIVAKHFIVDENLRDEVLSQQEQDDNNYFKLYNLLSLDAIESRGISNPFLTPKSIDYKQEIDGRLHPKYTFDINGWLVECEYFKNFIFIDPK